MMWIQIKMIDTCIHIWWLENDSQRDQKFPPSLSRQKSLAVLIRLDARNNVVSHEIVPPPNDLQISLVQSHVRSMGVDGFESVVSREP
jgi:hypothetical protein